MKMKYDEKFDMCYLICMHYDFTDKKDDEAEWNRFEKAIKNMVKFLRAYRYKIYKTHINDDGDYCIAIEEKLPEFMLDVAQKTYIKDDKIMLDILPPDDFGY